MDKPRSRKKSSPVNRFIVPAILIIILIFMIIVFAITIMSLAGLTPGA
jgi:hypothetical protein